MHEFKVGWFLVWAILPSGGRGHQLYLSGGTKACVCSPGRFLCLFFYLPLPFFPFPKPHPLILIKNKLGRVLQSSRSHQKQNILDKMWNKIRTFPLKEDFVYVCFVFVVLFLWGGRGMFIPLLSILCWIQILKNALFQQTLNKWWQNHGHQVENLWLTVSTNKMLHFDHFLKIS